MFRTGELRVRTVKRYRVPRYPSHNDPDPTMFPQRVPYPAAQKFLAAIASMGLAASLSSCAHDGSTASSADRPPSENPFRVERSGLPHQVSYFGNGAPQYIDDELARRAIEQVFLDAGYDLSANEPFTDEGISFVADGYDKEKQVGYILAGWRNLDRDAFDGCTAIEVKPGDTAAAVSALLDLAEGSSEYASLLDQAEAARRIPDPDRREAALQALLTEYGRDRISLAEMQLLEDRTPRTKRFVAVISHVDDRLQLRFSYGEQEAYSFEYYAIQQISNPAKREWAMRRLKEKQARRTIEALEYAVREYIAWARSQGAQ